MCSIIEFNSLTDEFKSYALEKPEYARIFITYHELKGKQKVSDDDNDQLFISYDVDRYAEFFDIESKEKEAQLIKDIPKAHTSEKTVNLESNDKKTD